MKNKTYFIAILLIILVVIFQPLLCFWLGYFTGWLSEITFGAKLCTAMNASLGIHLSPDLLPWLGGSLAWIGSFFKNVNNIKQNN